MYLGQTEELTATLRECPEVQYLPGPPVDPDRMRVGDITALRRMLADSTHNCEREPLVKSFRR